MSALDGPSIASFCTNGDLDKLDRVLGAIEGRLIALRALARSVPLPIPNPARDLARISYADRRRRGRVFAGFDIFGEPGWDILLDLYIAHCDRQDVSVSSACIAADVPPTTALRWIVMLGGAGLIIREPDPVDRRRINLRLTPEALHRMELYFGNVACGGERGVVQIARDRG